jgi:hypothetical protein
MPRAKGKRQEPPQRARKEPGRPGRRKGFNPNESPREQAERLRLAELLARATAVREAQPEDGEQAAPKRDYSAHGRRLGPRRELDRGQIVTFARAGCTNIEIAERFGVSEDTLTRHYSEELRIGRADGRVSLRVMQQFLAEAGNVAMLIWLGKQYLGQADRVDGNQNQTHTVKYLGPGIDPEQDLGPQGATREPELLTPGAPVAGDDPDPETGEPRAALDQSPIGTPEEQERRTCPHDGGVCHHDCGGDSCTRRDNGYGELSGNGNGNGNGNSSIDPPLPEGYEEYERQNPVNEYDPPADERWKNESRNPSPEDGRR